MQPEKIEDRIIDPANIKLVDINSIAPNPWNPKDKDTKEYKSVLESIQKYGLKSFIAVREKDGTYEDKPTQSEIIDGEQRWRAAKELGYTKILIYNEGKLDDKTAKELTVWWQVQVPFNDLSLAKMVTGMLKEYEDVFLPFTEAKLDEMKKVSEFDWGDYKNTPPEVPTQDQGNELLQSFMVQLTSEQNDIIQKAINKAKRVVGSDIETGKALEFVCVEYLNQAEGE